MDSSPKEEKDEDGNESSFSVKKQNEQLKKANRELWKRIEELQNEKTSIAEENRELKRKIDQSLPGNTFLVRLVNTSVLILQVRKSRSKLRVRWESPVPVLRPTSSGGI